MTRSRESATIEESLRLGAGFEAAEWADIAAQWRNLEARLKSFRRGSVDLEVSVNDRGTPTQRTVLEADIHNWPRLVATSTHRELPQALNEVRDDLIRQISDTKARMEPRNNRQRRVTTP